MYRTYNIKRSGSYVLYPISTNPDRRVFHFSQTKQKYTIIGTAPARPTMQNSNRGASQRVQHTTSTRPESITRPRMSRHETMHGQHYVIGGLNQNDPMNRIRTALNSNRYTRRTPTFFMHGPRENEQRGGGLVRIYDGNNTHNYSPAEFAQYVRRSIDSNTREVIISVCKANERGTDGSPSVAQTVANYAGVTVWTARQGIIALNCRTGELVDGQGRELNWVAVRPNN